MTQTAIPYHFLRGGTSRGPYFRRADLPRDEATLSQVLMAVCGAGHPLNIDGVGGGNAVTTKVAMLSPSARDDCDIDYFFAQVAVEKREVDFRPTCGNILVGVGPAAIEMGLVPAKDGETTVKIHAVNTGAVVEAVIQTPGGKVTYAGDCEIAGVSGTAAPIRLGFMETVGSITGALLPTGNLRDTIDGIVVTCMDVAVPVMLARAEDFGLTGYETQTELDENRAFFEQNRSDTVRGGQEDGAWRCVKVRHTQNRPTGQTALWRDSDGTLFHALDSASVDGCHRRAMYRHLRNPSGHRRRWPC